MEEGIHSGKTLTNELSRLEEYEQLMRQLTQQHPELISLLHHRYHMTHNEFVKKYQKELAFSFPFSNPSQRSKVADNINRYNPYATHLFHLLIKNNFHMSI